MDKSAIDTLSREIDLRKIPVHLRTALRRALEFEARAPAPRSTEEAEQCEEQLRAIADEFFGALLTPVLQRAVRSAAVGDGAVLRLDSSLERCRWGRQRWPVSGTAQAMEAVQVWRPVMLEWSKPVMGLSGGFLGAMPHEINVLRGCFNAGRLSIGRLCLTVVVLLLASAIGLWLVYSTSGELYPCSAVGSPRLV